MVGFLRWGGGIGVFRGAVVGLWCRLSSVGFESSF